MKAWLMSRQPHERIALLAGASILGVLLFYLAVWRPLDTAVDRKRQHVAEQRNTLHWMKKAAAEVQSYKSLNDGVNRNASNTALLSIVDQTARSHKLRNHIKRLKPQGDDKVQLWLEQAAFDNIMQWLGNMSETQHVIVESLSIDRQAQSGVVNARITLGRPTS